MAQFLKRLYYGNTVTEWLLALFLIVAAFLLGRVLYWMMTRYVQRLTRLTRTRIDDLLIDMLEEPFTVAFVLLGLQYAIGTLTFSERVVEFTDHLFAFLLTMVVAWFVVRFYDAFHQNYLIRIADQTATDLDDQMLPILRTGVRFIVIMLGIIIGLNNAGYDVGTVLAGLGIGGLAFALAAQDTVSNMFGGITVLVQRPFKTGDRIRVAGMEGYVRQVGLRTSLLEMVTGEKMFVPNKLFINETVTNMEESMYYFQSDRFRLHRDTTSQRLDEIAVMVRAALETNEHLLWTDMFLFQVADHSLDVDIVYGIKPWKADQPFDHHLHKMGALRSFVTRTCLEVFEQNGVKLAMPYLAYVRPEVPKPEGVFQP